MIKIEEKLQDLILNVVKEKFNIELNCVRLELPPKKELGDFAFGCFVLSKDLRKGPNKIAEEICRIEEFKNNKIIDELSSSGPYINIRISKKIYTTIFNELYFNDSIVGNIGVDKTIIVDYIGANVGKPLHIGHMCTPNQGQSMINVYRRLGYNVISDSHIGDWGIIFGKLITAFKIWGDDNKLKEDAVNYLLELYIKISSEAEEKGEEIEKRIRFEFKLLSEGNIESVKLWSKFTKYSIGGMNAQLNRLNVKPDFNIGESFYEGLGLPKMENYPDLEFDMKSIVDELILKNIATKNEDDSVGVIFNESTKMPSCILQKRDGTHGYLASDLAAIKYRCKNWNPEKIIYFVDSRQQLHLKQVFEIAKNAGWINNTELFHAFNGFISLKDGAMSTRKGRIIKLDSLLNEAEKRAKKIILEKRCDIEGEELCKLSKIIGIGAIKYGYLKKSRETDVIFDWDEFMSFEGNSGPYIQYAYVRSIRILEKSLIDFDIRVDGEFTTSEEIELIKSISNYNNILINSTKNNTPHLICEYAYKLTKTFSSFYNNVHILSEKDNNVKIIRLQLVKLFSETLKNSFGVIGIDMPDKM